MHYITAVINLAEFMDKLHINTEEYVVAGDLAMRLRGYIGPSYEISCVEVAFPKRIQTALLDRNALYVDDSSFAIRWVNKQYHIAAAGADERVSWKFENYLENAARLDPNDTKSPFVLTDKGLLSYYESWLDNIKTPQPSSQEYKKVAGRVSLLRINLLYKDIVLEENHNGRMEGQIA